MSLYPLVKNAATKVYNRFAGKPGDLLLWTGTIGWILSSLGQLSAIVVNKKIPNDQKKFLIPQEMGDAAANIASFFILTKSVTRFGEHLVKSGKLSTPGIKKALGNLSSQMATKGFNIAKLDQMNELDPKFDKNLQHEYNKFADGVSFVASTIGSIISCNIITPILRNKFAANRQKHSIEQDKIKNDLILPTSPVLPAQNDLGKDNYKVKTVNNPYPTSGSMKI